MNADRADRNASPSLTDGALDTLGCVFQTLGEESFPIDSTDDPREFAALCLEIVRHIENGAAAPSVGIESISGLRDWRTVRRFYVDRRRHENSFVSSRLEQYRDIVGHFIVGLRDICAQNDATEQLIAESLGAIEAAIERGGLANIKKAVGLAVRDVGSAFEDQKRQYETQISALNERVNALREDLVAAKEEMQLDPLTGVCNRGAFDAAIQRYMNTRFMLGQPVSVIMVDIDYFKNINDRLGHPAGDSILKSVAACLSRCFIRKNDLIARYGGDEFAIILPDTDVTGSSTSVCRMLEAVRRIQIDADFGATPEIAISCSAGCAEMQDRDTVDSLIERADQALYEAKQAGRDCFRTA